MAVGILIGNTYRKTMNSGNSQPGTVSNGQSGPSQEAQSTEQTPESEVVMETVPEHQKASENETEPAVSVNARELTMDIINYYLYQQRDYFVELYGRGAMGNGHG